MRPAAPSDWGLASSSAAGRSGRVGIFGIILRMKRHLAALLALAAAFSARASWYWPFGSDDKPAKPRISELVEPASLLVDSAADLAMDELLRIEVENPVPRR